MLALPELAAIEGAAWLHRSVIGQGLCPSARRQMVAASGSNTPLTSRDVLFPAPKKDLMPVVLF
jgi:hypothetical protein